MKFLILACFLGFAAASLLEHAAPAVDEAVNAVLEGMSRAGSLRAALDMPHAYEMDMVEEEIKEDMVKVLKEHLNNLLEKIKEHIDHGKVVTGQMLDKLGEMKEKLKEMHEDMGNKAKELLEKIKEKTKNKVKEIWEKIKEKLGLSGVQRRSLNHIFDEIARLNVKDFLENIKEKVITNETVQKIREWMKNFVTNCPIVTKIKEMIAEMRDVDIKELLHTLFHRDTSRSVRTIREWWEKMKETFKEKHMLLKEHWIKFGEWLKELLAKGLDKLKDKHQIIKSIALEFIAHAKDMHAEACRQALEFLSTYKKDLGALWEEIVNTAKEHLGHEVY